MLIDWFTVVAQIVNFLILVLLLKVFLYDRIIKAMDEREQHIAHRLQSAEEQKQVAETEAALYRQQQQELEAERATLLDQAKEEVNTQRHELLDKAHLEIETLQRRWHKALSDEKASFLRDLRQRASQQVNAIARRALTDLADADLEQQMMASFLDKLQTLDKAVWEAIVVAQQDATQPLVVHSAFAVPQEARQKLLNILQEHLGAPANVRFEAAPEVMCGIELQSNGRKIAWSLADYLETLEACLETALNEATGEDPVDNHAGRTVVDTQQMG